MSEEDHKPAEPAEPAAEEEAGEGAEGGGEGEEEPGLAEEAAAVAESAAELGVGAIIAPFAGGQTVDMVESLVEIVEAGVDRLTHLGHPEHAGAQHTDGQEEAEDRTE